MKWIITILTIFSFHVAYAQFHWPWEKKPPPKKKVLKRVTKKPAPTPAPTPKPELNKPVTFLVDAEWLARYRILEAIHADYTIPEDDLIVAENGKYRVPATVFRHYEDMYKTPKKDSIDY